MMSTEKSTADRPVLRAIAGIMKDVGSIEKRGHNKFHNYDYATAADIMHMLQPKMAQAGLLIVPYQTKLEIIIDDSAMIIEFEFLVQHESGDRLEDRPKFSGMSSCKNSKGGFDDKAANKCLTAAMKYFLLNLFKIPTGDYSDADAGENDRNNGQRQQLKNLPSPQDRPKQSVKPAASLTQVLHEALEANGTVTDEPTVTIEILSGEQFARKLGKAMSIMIERTNQATGISKVDVGKLMHRNGGWLHKYAKPTLNAICTAWDLLPPPVSGPTDEMTPFNDSLDEVGAH